MAEEDLSQSFDMGSDFTASDRDTGAAGQAHKHRIHGRRGSARIQEVAAGPLMDADSEFGRMIGAILQDNAVGIVNVTDDAGRITPVFLVSPDRMKTYYAAMDFASKATHALIEQGLI